ncbi:solute carrier family 15 member 1 [Elysia marginata]|uniref:Solute carrier family 15 member 1 n=1 Tax=Elysia marginata TaxID=1093978 RepID=A0AAV4FZE3_9GAST|nr:solute carrier family 15 member 1 [Elysia marginata]
MSRIKTVQFVSLRENQVSMFWQIPQYVVITCGEILFSITGLSFAYSQAPTSMKSVLQAAWLMTVAFGNLVVIVFAEARLVQRQVPSLYVFLCLSFFTTSFVFFP